VPLGLASAHSFGDSFGDLLLLRSANVIQIYTLSQQLFEYVTHKVFIDLICAQI
jgi:hypothetical protein